MTTEEWKSPEITAQPLVSAARYQCGSGYSIRFTHTHHMKNPDINDSDGNLTAVSTQTKN